MMINPNSNRSAAWALGNDPWVFTRRRNSPLSRSMALVLRGDFHCRAARCSDERGVVFFMTTRQRGEEFHIKRSLHREAFLLCAKHVRQLGDESSLSNLMEVKD